MKNRPLLQVKNLKTYFKLSASTLGRANSIVKAVDDVSFDVLEGEIVGIVGESGCGKSTLGKTIIRLNAKTSGEILYLGEDVFEMNREQFHNLCCKSQMIFQDPFSCLNPRKKLKTILNQPLRIHKIGTKAQRQEKIEKTLYEVGLNPSLKNRYPHQFSGGQRQRIGIARALMLNPEFVICDEAVSALDISIQAQIINLLLDLREKYKLTYIFISHDLAVVEFISTRILVMYLGKIVESGTKEQISKNNLHPYTKALFDAFPSSSPVGREKRVSVVMGDVPSPINPPKGCHFHPRCKFAKDICKREYPPLKEVKKGHSVACFLYQKTPTD